MTFGDAFWERDAGGLGRCFVDPTGGHSQMAQASPWGLHQQPLPCVFTNPRSFRAGNARLPAPMLP